MSDPSTAAREHVLDAHADTVTAVIAAADAVASNWDGDATTDRARVVEPMGEIGERTGLLDRLPAVLSGAVEAAGFSMQAPPVPGPPYVVVTSRGPLLRATVDSGRLLVRFDVFRVERGSPTRYVRGSADPAAVVAAAYRR